MAGRGDPPEEWLISRLCEEFGIPPSVAVREPLALCLRIVEMRAYARVREAARNASQDEQIPKGPLADLVFEIEHELIRTRNARIQARENARSGA